ncbi:MAG: tRNA (adenosine(37)-N6)-threonylcarbamoyltransferase complex dimerization subunit type 1 TsaB [Amphiplicatus sp.]
MLVLGLDTALKSCSAALLSDGALLGERRLALEKGHAEHLAPLVAALFEETGLGVADLDRVGVVIGPGAFAGVRVGLAFARGLALGTGLKPIGVTSLAALAASVDAPLAAAVIDARRGQVYAGLYEEGAARLPPFVATPADAAQRLIEAAGQARLTLVGDGAALLPPAPQFAPSAAPTEIDAKCVARLAAAAPEPAAPPAPLYLRPPDAKPGAKSLFEGLFETAP